MTERELHPWEVAITPYRQKLIDKIRADKKVGKGTCSSIDECSTDVELLYQIAPVIENTLKPDLGKLDTMTPAAAVKEARRLEKLWIDLSETPCY